MPPIYINGQEVIKRYVGIQEVVAAYVGAQQVFGASFDVYVDSINGNDSNSGTSAAQAKQTIGAITLEADLRIGLARGSYWREELGSVVTPPSGISVGAYGEGTMPTLDAANTISSGAWSKTGGRTYVYEATVAYTTQSTGEFMSLWEDGARLRWVASVALCDATAGTYYVANTNGSGSATMYVHPTGNGNPASNGKTYENSARLMGIYGGHNWVIDGIHTKRNLCSDGSLKVLTGSTVRNCLAEDGTKHNLFIGGNSVAEDCIAWKADWADRTGSTMFVAYETNGVGKASAFRRCVARVDPAVSAVYPSNQAIIGFYAHTAGDGAKFDSVTYEDCAVYGAYEGYGISNCTAYINTRCLADTVQSGFTHSAVTSTLTDPYVKSGAAQQLKQGIRTFSGTANIDGFRLYTLYGTWGLYAQDAAVSNMHNSVLVRGAGATGFAIMIFGNVGGATTENLNNIIQSADSNCYLFYRAGAGDSQDNCYYPSTGDFHIGSTDYVDFAAYRAANALLDVVSTTTDPLLVDPANGDFSVQAGSPAVALGAGLLRPNVTYTAVPSDAALGAM